MRKILVWPGIMVGVLIALGVGACTRGTDMAGRGDSVDPFVALVTTGLGADFDPLTSADDAIDKADLAVDGEVVDVVEGVSVQFADPVYTQRWANSYMTLVVSVDHVIVGNPADVRAGEVFLVVRKSTGVTIEQLAAANPHPKVVAVMGDVSTWSPATDAQVVRPADVPGSAKLFAAYTDGLWLQAAGDATMRGFGTEHLDLAEAWGHPDTVDEFAAALVAAAH